MALIGHEGGNPGHRQGPSYRTTAPVLDPLPRPPGAVRGTARVQLSTPRVTFPAGSTSDVTFRARIRAHYTPDADTVMLPETIHGEVHVRYSIDLGRWLPYEERELTVTPTADDDQIQFLPAAGTVEPGSDDAKEIAQQIRNVVRGGFEPVTLNLAAGFPLAWFKALGTGDAQVLALIPVLPGGTPRPQSALALITTPFLNPGDHFAVAISKKYITPKLEPALSALEGSLPGYEAEDPWGGTAVAYAASVSDATLEFQAGQLVLVAEGQVSIYGWLASALGQAGNFPFTVTQTLALTLKQGTLSLEAPMDPDISGLSPTIENWAMPRIKKERDEALAEAQSQIQTLTNAFNLDEALEPFDDSTTSSLTSVDIREEGAILRGVIAMKARPPVVVEFTETGDETAFTALQSWIPGGTIDRFRWSWTDINPDVQSLWDSVWGLVLHEEVVEHSFLLRNRRDPTALPAQGHVCLRVEGTQGPVGTRGGPAGLGSRLPDVLRAVRGTVGGRVGSVDGGAEFAA